MKTVALIAVWLGLTAAFRPAMGAEETIAARNGSEFQQRAGADVPFFKGSKPGLVGFYSHTEVAVPLEEARKNLVTLLDTSPLLSGISIKLWWKTLHPEKDVMRWDGLENIIRLCAERHKQVHITIFPGMNSPAWIYAEGVKRVGPVTVGGRADLAPVLWNAKYVELFTADITELARRYADDPRVGSIQITGHHYKGGEMHAPNGASMAPLVASGITHAVVLENWKYWIDLFGKLFPHKKLNLVISQMYPAQVNGEDFSTLPEEVTAYFVKNYQGRAILQTMQLNGRGSSDRGMMSQDICLKYSDDAPNCHEMVASFTTQPERQGTCEMTIYNFIRQKNPLYLQLWRIDGLNAALMQRMADAWKRYGQMEPEELKARLKEEGKWIETSNFDPAAFRIDKERKQPKQSSAKSQADSL